MFDPPPPSPPKGCGIDVVSGPNYDCNGNGVCVEASNICVCDDHATGKTDFINVDGIGCPIDRRVVYALWTVNLVVFSLCAAKSLPRLYSMYGVHRQKLIQAKEAGQKYSIMKNKGLLSMLIYWGSTPAHVALGIWIMADVNTSLIGIFAVPSLLWIVARGGFHLAASIYQPSLLDAMLRSEREAVHVIRRYRRYGLALASFATGIGFLVLINVGFRGENYNVALATFIAYFLGQAIELAGYAIQAHFLSKRISRILDESYRISQSDEVLEIKGKMIAVQHNVRNTSIVQMTVYGLFSMIPMAYVYHAYFLPLTWIALPITGLKATIAVSHRTGSSKRSSLATSDTGGKKRGSNAKGGSTNGSNLGSSDKRGSGLNAQNQKRGSGNEATNDGNSGNGNQQGSKDAVVPAVE